MNKNALILYGVMSEWFLKKSFEDYTVHYRTLIDFKGTGRDSKFIKARNTIYQKYLAKNEKDFVNSICKIFKTVKRPNTRKYLLAVVISMICPTEVIPSVSKVIFKGEAGNVDDANNVADLFVSAIKHAGDENTNDEDPWINILFNFLYIGFKNVDMNCISFSIDRAYDIAYSTIDFISKQKKNGKKYDNLVEFFEDFKEFPLFDKSEQQYSKMIADFQFAIDQFDENNAKFYLINKCIYYANVKSIENEFSDPNDRKRALMMMHDAYLKTRDQEKLRGLSKDDKIQIFRFLMHYDFDFVIEQDFKDFYMLFYKEIKPFVESEYASHLIEYREETNDYFLPERNDSVNSFMEEVTECITTEIGRIKLNYADANYALDKKIKEIEEKNKERKQPEAKSNEYLIMDKIDYNKYYRSRSIFGEL